MMLFTNYLQADRAGLVAGQQARLRVGLRATVYGVGCNTGFPLRMRAYAAAELHPGVRK